MTGKKQKELVTYISTIRVSEKGEVVLPKEYREEQHLEAGSEVAALKMGNGLLLLPQMGRYNSICSSIEGILAHNDLTADDFTSTLEETRNDLFAEVYPRAARKK